MTQATITNAYPTTKWGLFRFDVDSFSENTVVRGWYQTEDDAKKILDKINSELPRYLKKILIIKEVPIQPADQFKKHQFAAIS